jgi:hypothetical protein
VWRCQVPELSKQMEEGNIFYIDEEYELALEVIPLVPFTQIDLLLSEI